MKAIIKKYEDRRLYDTTASRYVNLEDVARMIRQGIEVQVIDARKGEDLTRMILTQIIVENARGREAGLPLEFLRRLIMASDEATHDFLIWYWNTTLDMYQKAEEALRSGLSEAKAAARSPLEFLGRLLPGLPQARPAESDEVQALRRRIAELEAQLGARKAAARRPRTRKPRE
jgi:polyhydroxyalkanoate synthesis repressor PhaR